MKKCLLLLGVLSLTFTYYLSPWCRVLLEKLTGLQLVKKFLAFLRNPTVNYRTHKRQPRLLQVMLLIKVVVSKNIPYI